MKTIIEGSNLMLFLNSAMKSIPLATSHTLSISAETSDVSNKDVADGKWKAEQIKQFSWEATTDNLYAADAFDELFAAMTAGTPINAFFGLKANVTPFVDYWNLDTTQPFYTGQVIITSLQANAQNGENATFSATFTGVGELHYNDPDQETGVHDEANQGGGGGGQ